MKGDYSRDSFDPTKQFTRVLMQQGRVQLDADWNEQTSILLHYLQSLTRDLIGPAGGPRDFLGFEIAVVEESSGKEVGDLTIGTGRYYVDGLLSENAPQLDLIGDPADIDRPTIEPARKVEAAISSPSGSAQGVSYYHQPNYPHEPQPDELKVPLLVYLDLWERHICAFEDPDIREVALRGPDTSTRAKIVWQVKVSPLDTTDITKLTCAGFEDTEIWNHLVEKLQPANRGHLKARANAPKDSDEPCMVAPEARFRGEENQLYRVEIHRFGTAGDQNKGATFKWSRENGAVVFPIQSIDGQMVTLENLGRDDRFGLEVGDWVEVVDDDYSLLGLADALLSVEDIDLTVMRVTLSAAPQGTVGQDLNKHPLLRRWDQQKGDPNTGGLELAKGSALIVESSSAWLNLEDGVQIQFQGGAEYRTGDYWLIPARTETGDVEWPGPVDHPQAVPPHGVQHHYAPLAIVFSRAALSPGPAAGTPDRSGVSVRPFATTDLRHRFAPAGQCCPTVTLDYPLAATQDQSPITFEVQVRPPVLNLTFEWEVEGGTIAPPSSTPSVRVNINADSAEVKARVTITGLPPFCPNIFEGTSVITRPER